jgi:hypothetical protein
VFAELEEGSEELVEVEMKEQLVQEVAWLERVEVGSEDSYGSSVRF